MDIIKNNPYRIIGILSNATAKEIQSRKSKITAYAKVGKQITSDFDFPLFNSIERVKEPNGIIPSATQRAAVPTKRSAMLFSGKPPKSRK